MMSPISYHKHKYIFHDSSVNIHSFIFDAGSENALHFIRASYCSNCSQGSVFELQNERRKQQKSFVYLCTGDVTTKLLPYFIITRPPRQCPLIFF